MSAASESSLLTGFLNRPMAGAMSTTSAALCTASPASLSLSSSPPPHTLGFDGERSGRLLFFCLVQLVRFWDKIFQVNFLEIACENMRFVGTGVTGRQE